MRTLVDTCVLSEARRPKGDPAVRAALEAIPDADVFLSVITVAELVRGVELLPASERRSVLETWVRGIEEHHADRILPIDLRVARLWGEIDAKAKRSKPSVTIPVADGLIAATALRHDLQLMTRNVADFEPTGVRLTNPWKDDA